MRTVDQLPLRVRRKLAKEVKKVIASSGSIKESALEEMLVHFCTPNPKEAQVKAKNVAELQKEKVAAKGRAASRLRGLLRRIAASLLPGANLQNLSTLSSEERRLLGNLRPEFADSF